MPPASRLHLKRGPTPAERLQLPATLIARSRSGLSEAQHLGLRDGASSSPGSLEIPRVANPHASQEAGKQSVAEVTPGPSLSEAGLSQGCSLWKQQGMGLTLSMLAVFSAVLTEDLQPPPGALTLRGSGVCRQA